MELSTERVHHCVSRYASALDRRRPPAVNLVRQPPCAARVSPHIPFQCVGTTSARATAPLLRVPASPAQDGPPRLRELDCDRRLNPPGVAFSEPGIMTLDQPLFWRRHCGFSRLRMTRASRRRGQDKAPEVARIIDFESRFDERADLAVSQQLPAALCNCFERFRAEFDLPERCGLSNWRRADTRRR